MSARVSRSVPPKAAGRNQRKKMVLDVDLNALPSDEVGTSSHVPDVSQQQGSQQEAPPQVVPIDVDSIDDDVIVCSPRAFAEAKNNSRRNQTRRNVVEIDSESTSRIAANHRSKRQRVPTNQPIINIESYIPERNYDHVGGNGKNFPVVVPPPRPPPPPPPPPEPAFNCPVCMGPLVEEMTTKCGHIFCKACIKKSISSQGKCPTCRRKVTLKDTIRIFLPATS